MDSIDTGSRNLWLFVYFVAGIGVLLNLLSEAYFNTLKICIMYPQFSFLETLLDEILMHHTWIPLVHVHLPTLYLLGVYVVVYAAKHWRLWNQVWPLLVDLLSGHWFNYELFESLSFIGTDPDVPDLLSEDEILQDGNDQVLIDGTIPSLPIDHEACNEAFAKLVQVKMQHANRIISRPDDWLVFDPVQEKLVLQKHITCGRENHKFLHKHSNGSKVDHWQEREWSRDNGQASLFVTDIDTEVQTNQPSEVATKTTI